MPETDKSSLDNRARQLNPNNPAYGQSRSGSGDSRAAHNNRCIQMNPNNPTYHSSRGGCTPARGQAHGGGRSTGGRAGK